MRNARATYVDIKYLKKWKLSHIYIGQQHYGSESYAPTDRYSLILASWVSDDANIDFDADYRPAIVKYYIHNTLKLGSQLLPHMFAYVEWPNRLNEDVGLLDPLSAWDAKKTLRRSEASFIPIQRILSKGACAKDRLVGRDCLIVAQLEPKLYL